MTDKETLKWSLCSCIQMIQKLGPATAVSFNNNLCCVSLLYLLIYFTLLPLRLRNAALCQLHILDEEQGERYTIIKFNPKVRDAELDIGVKTDINIPEMVNPEK